MLSLETLRPPGVLPHSDSDGLLLRCFWSSKASASGSAARARARSIADAVVVYPLHTGVSMSDHRAPDDAGADMTAWPLPACVLDYRAKYVSRIRWGETCYSVQSYFSMQRTSGKGHSRSTCL